MWSHGKATTIAAVGLAGVLTLITAVPARATGWPVFDFATFTGILKVWKQDISTTAKLVQEVKLAQQILQNGQQMYLAEQYMEQRFKSKQGMNTFAQQFVGNYTRNKYGESVTWPMMMNGGGGMAHMAWLQSTLAMSQRASGAMAGQTPGSSKDLAALAYVEQVDGSSEQCLENLSQYQKNTQLNQNKVGFLNLNAIDSSSATGSLIKQLSLTVMGQQQGNNEQRAQGQLQSCLAQQQTLTNKLQRDTIAYQANYAADAHLSIAAPTWDGQTQFGAVWP